MVYDVIKDLDIAIQINKLKTFGANYSQALYGIIKRIQSINPNFDLKIGGANTNLKKKFPTIGEILYRQNEPREYINAIKELSPLLHNELAQSKHLRCYPTILLPTNLLQILLTYSIFQFTLT